MQTPRPIPLVILDDTFKAKITKHLVTLVTRPVIGPTAHDREKVFALFNKAILERHLLLLPFEGHEDLSAPEAEERLNYMAYNFYQNRPGFLSISDYVTDFLDIVRNSKLTVISRAE